MEATERHCEECGRPPRRMSLEMEGLLFCQRDCYVSYCARRWDRAFTETYLSNPRPPVLKLQKEIKTA